ncbi:MAG: hypothetical protein PHZ11_07575 [Desulfitobacteriaceae bacterium]|nr:hypothetical protein [Desulfitobacteriaceae bacterium]
MLYNQPTVCLPFNGFRNQHGGVLLHLTEIQFHYVSGDIFNFGKLPIHALAAADEERIRRAERLDGIKHAGQVLHFRHGHASSPIELMG